MPENKQKTIFFKFHFYFQVFSTITMYLQEINCRLIINLQNKYN